MKLGLAHNNASEMACVWVLKSMVWLFLVAMTPLTPLQARPAAEGKQHAAVGLFKGLRHVQLCYKEWVSRLHHRLKAELHLINQTKYPLLVYPFH